MLENLKKIIFSKKILRLCHLDRVPLAIHQEREKERETDGRTNRQRGNERKKTIQQLCSAPVVPKIFD